MLHVSITSQWSSTVAAKLVGYIHMYLSDAATNLGKIAPTAHREDHRRNDSDRLYTCERAFFLILISFSLRSRNLGVKGCGSVLETRDRALPPQVITSGGEDKKNLMSLVFPRRVDLP